MRPEDLTDYVALRGLVDNPLEVARFRKGQGAGDVLEVRFQAGASLFLRGETADYQTFHRIFLRDEYRLAGVSPGAWACVVDLGANVGIFAARAAPLTGRVLSFEPIPEQFSLLERNARPNVTAFPLAVAGCAGTLRIHRPTARGRTGSASAFPGEGHSDADWEDAAATTLDAIFADNAVAHCDLLKVDVEGAEYDILYAASEETLGRIQRIHAEYHLARPDDPRAQSSALAAHLTAHGFRVETIPHPKKPRRGMLFAAR